MRQAKQVLVVRKDLKMRKGKVGAQCAHASTKAILSQGSRVIYPDGKRLFRFEYGIESPWAQWLESGSAKVCVYVEDEQALLDVYEKALSLGLPATMIVDSGRTEFGGIPTRTVVAVGPGWVDEVDAVTGGLTLY